jgi:hypothetical protein
VLEHEWFWRQNRVWRERKPVCELSARKAIGLFDVAAQAKQKDQRIGILDRDDKVVKEIVGI